MRLSELSPYAGTETSKVLKDCEISSIELCTKITGTKALTYLEKEKFLPMIENASISGVICREQVAGAVLKLGKGVLISDAPKFCFYSLHNYMAQRAHVAEVPSKSVIGPGCHISPDAVIAPNYVRIGKDVTIEAGAVIHEHVTIGNHVRIDAGAVIGARSFNPSRYHDKTIVMEDCGRVVIEDFVEICSNSTIVRGVLPNEITVVGAYSKIDTLIHVAHGVQIGKRSFLASGAVIAGNVRIGDDVWIGVNATISNRIRIGDGARVSLGSVVTKDVPAGATVTGNFAIDHQQFLKNLKDSLAED